MANEEKASAEPPYTSDSRLDRWLAGAQGDSRIGRWLGEDTSMISRMSRDTVTLTKPDGRQFQGIKANVQPEIIFIPDTSLPIEEGDTIERILPNNLVEQYRVLDRGYYSGQGSIRAHYQVKVRKGTTMEAERQATTIYNLHGANPRVNINSRDQSINVVETSAGDLFDRLRKLLQTEIADPQQRAALIAQTERMESAQGSPSYVERYKEFMALAADHLGVLQPVLTGLAQLLIS